LQLLSGGQWRLLQYESPQKLETVVEVGGNSDPDTLPGTLVHGIYQIDLDAHEQRVSLDGGKTFTSASLPENSSLLRFAVHNASDWERGSIVMGKVRIESISTRQEAEQNQRAAKGQKP